MPLATRTLWVGGKAQNHDCVSDLYALARGLPCISTPQQLSRQGRAGDKGTAISRPMRSSFHSPLPSGNEGRRRRLVATRLKRVIFSEGEVRILCNAHPPFSARFHTTTQFITVIHTLQLKRPVLCRGTAAVPPYISPASMSLSPMAAQNMP